MKTITVCLLGLLILFAQSVSAREFRLALITPSSHNWTRHAEAFGESLSRETGGRLSVVIYPSQQLGNEAQLLQQLQTGAVDMAFLTAAEVSNRVPEFGALYAPYLVKDIADAATLLRSDEATAMLDLLPRKIGVMGIAYGMGGMRQILTRESTLEASDLRGRKIRITPFPPIRDFYLFLGAAPTPMPLESVYDALANGQVSAIDMDLELIVKLKYYELAQTVLLSNHMMFPMVGLVSARVWVRLENADQVLIRELMKRELDSIIAGTVTEEAGYLEKLRETGIEIVTADEQFFGDAVQQWDDAWRKQAPVLDTLRKASLDSIGNTNGTDGGSRR